MTYFQFHSIFLLKKSTQISRIFYKMKNYEISYVTCITKYVEL